MSVTVKNNRALSVAGGLLALAVGLAILGVPWYAPARAKHIPWQTTVFGGGFFTLAGAFLALWHSVKVIDGQWVIERSYLGLLPVGETLVRYGTAAEVSVSPETRPIGNGRRALFYVVRIVGSEQDVELEAAHTRPGADAIAVRVAEHLGVKVRMRGGDRS